MFWERLNLLCAEHNVKLTNVVKELGMSTGNQSKWKNGVVPKSNVLKKFADYFDVSVDYLLGNTTSKIVVPPAEKDEAEIPDMEATLLYFFANCDTEGQCRIIQVAMNEYDRTQKEKTDSQGESAIG